MRKTVLAALFIQVLFAAGNAQAQEQKILFCADSISFTKRGYFTNEFMCSEACERKTNVSKDCLSSQLAEGWEVTATSPMKVPQYMDEPCSCVGTQYILKKPSQMATAKARHSEKEIELLMKENDLLKKENTLLKDENATLKGKSRK